MPVRCVAAASVEARLAPAGAWCAGWAGGGAGGGGWGATWLGLQAGLQQRPCACHSVMGSEAHMVLCDLQFLKQAKMLAVLANSAACCLFTHYCCHWVRITCGAQAVNCMLVHLSARHTYSLPTALWAQTWYCMASPSFQPYSFATYSCSCPYWIAGEPASCCCPSLHSSEPGPAALHLSAASVLNPQHRPGAACCAGCPAQERPPALQPAAAPAGLPDALTAGICKQDKQGSLKLHVTLWLL